MARSRRLQLLEEEHTRTRSRRARPIGFVCDHIEVLYDLDREAADVCTHRPANGALKPSMTIRCSWTRSAMSCCEPGGVTNTAGRCRQRLAHRSGTKDRLGAHSPGSGAP